MFEHIPSHELSRGVDCRPVTMLQIVQRQNLIALLYKMLCHHAADISRCPRYQDSQVICTSCSRT